jgi:hypothetical protein
MPRKAYGVMNASDLHVVRASILLILFWVALWNLTEIVINWIEEKYNIPRWKVYAGIVVFILAVIVLDPYTFEKL